MVRRLEKYARLAGVAVLGLASSLASGQLSPNVPHDIPPFSPGKDLTPDFMRFAWQNFIALNWPAQIDAAGNPIPVPDTTKTPAEAGGAYVTVWEAWPEARDTFLPGGAAPAAWGTPHPVPSICTGVQSAGQEQPKVIFHAASKGGAVLDEFVQALRMGPVIDANGEYVRYGINFNKSLYDYVVQNTLYNKAGQQAFSRSHPEGASFPRGQYDGSEVGAIMVKSSWKILGPDDKPEDFHRIQALIYDPEQPDTKENCRVAEVGMVGFHITHRTGSAPQWVWATFEHTDNAPSWAEATGVLPKRDHYSFFDFEKCPTEKSLPSCKYNALPVQPWNPQISGQEQTMVIRTGNITQTALSINMIYQKSFPNQAWENYMLMDVQWPTQVLMTSSVARVNPAYPDGQPIPTFLANSTMETYIQGFVPGDQTSNSDEVPPGDLSDTHPSNPQIGWTGGTQRNTSSCVNCHGDASMTTGLPANFVFSLNRAQGL